MTYVKFNQPSLRAWDNFVGNMLNELPSSKEQGFYPPVNIVETKDNYELQLNVPGRRKEDFKITFDKNILTVSFDAKEAAPDENRKQIKSEFSLKSFKRSFTLDDKVNSENIAAKYDNGLLILTIPKKEEVKAEAKKIAVS